MANQPNHAQNPSVVAIGNTQLSIVFYQGQPVITLAMMDQAHERPEGTAGRNFREHQISLSRTKITSGFVPTKFVGTKSWNFLLLQWGWIGIPNVSAFTAIRFCPKVRS